MFGRFKKTIKCKHFIGMSFTDSGIALASISKNSKQQIAIENIQFVAVNSVAEKLAQLKIWTKSKKINDELINFVLAPEELKMVLSEAAQVDDAELAKAMQWKLKELIDIPVEQAVVDYISIPGQQERGRKPMVYVVSSEKKRIKEYIQMIEHEHLNLHSIDIPAMVNRNIASFLPEDQHGVGLLKLEANKGLLTLSRQGELYLSRDLELGYEQLQQELQQQDQELSTNHMLDQIVLEVQRSVDYYERYFAHPAIKSLVIAPTPNTLVGVPEYLSEQLGISVRNLDLTECFDLGQDIDRGLQSLCFPAIGAALRWPLVA